jgi:hypothetical protein
MASNQSLSQGSASTLLQSRPRPPSQRLSYPRQRAIRACQLCRARRTKCDNKKPTCSFCEKIGVECVTSDGENPVLDTASLKILQRLDDLETLVKSLQLPTVSPSDTARTKEQASQLRVTTEALLSWAVFRAHYDTRCDLKRLLRGDPSSTASVASPTSIDSFATAGELEPTSCKRSLDNFFHFVHVKNPMLDEGKVRLAVHRVCLEGPAWDAESCLVLLVCALGSIASSFDGSSVTGVDMRSMAVAQSYFNAAQKRIGTITGTGGVLEAQCFFYSGVYLMSKLQPIKAWRLFTQALACCQEFSCANSSYAGSSGGVSSVGRGLPEEECVYWSCWKSEIELRMCLDLPDFPFNDLSYPLLFPTPPAPFEGKDATAWYFYLSEISLRRLEHRVRDEISNVLKGDDSASKSDLYTSTAAFEGLAEEWLQSLPHPMNLHTPQAEDDVLRFILRGHFLNLWEVIYWPFFEKFFNQRSSEPHVEIYVRKGLQIGIDRIRINKPGFCHRHHGTWLMLQSCTRSALALLAAAYCPEATVLLPNDWKEAVFDTIELLRYWQDEVADAADRLQILEELISVIS